MTTPEISVATPADRATIVATLGHAVMAEGLNRAAQAGLPAVLETASEGNVAMYQRAGWEVIASVTDPLPIWVLAQGR